MAKSFKKDYITFAGGLNTETNYVREDTENTAKEIKNFKLNKDGSIEKRGGLTTDDVLFDFGNLNETKPEMILWESPVAREDFKLYVVFQTDRLFFFEARLGLTMEGFIGSYSLAPHVVDALEEENAELKVSFSQNSQYVLVVGKYLNPISISWEYETVSPVVREIDIKIRDYRGVSNIFKPVIKTTVDDIPGGNRFKIQPLNDEFIYNLENNNIPFEEYSKRSTYLENSNTPGLWGGAMTEDVYEFLGEETVGSREWNVDDSSYGGDNVLKGGSKIISAANVLHYTTNSGIPVKINLDNVESYADYGGQTHFTVSINKPDNVATNDWQVATMTQEPHTYNLPVQAKTFSYFDAEMPARKTFIYNELEDIGRFEYYNDADMTVFEITDTVNNTFNDINSRNFNGSMNLFKRNTGLLNDYIMIFRESRSDAIFPTEEDFYNDNYLSIQSKIENNFGGNITFGFTRLDGGATNFTAITIIRFSIEDSVDNIKNNVYALDGNERFTWFDYEYVFVTINGVLAETEKETLVSSKAVSYMWRPTIDTIIGEPGFTPNNFVVKFLDDKTLKVVIGNRYFETLEENPLQDNDPNKDTNYTNIGLRRNITHPNRKPEYETGFDSELPNDFNRVMGGMTFFFNVLQTQELVYSTEEYRPECSAFYAGRAWYSGWDSENFSNYIFYSQTLETPNQFGYCYAKNDPNDPDFNIALATDGGFLQISDLDKIEALVPFKDYLLVFTKEEVSMVFGSPFFAGDNVSYRKIADIGIAGKNSWTQVGDSIVFASSLGIHQLKLDKGQLKIVSLSNNKLNSYYNSLSREQKNEIRVDYNKFNKRVNILLNRNISRTPDAYDTMLCYDFDLEAFYEYDFGFYSTYQIVDFQKDYYYNESSDLSLLVYKTDTGAYGNFKEGNSFRDFEENNTPFPCAIESNYITFDSMLEEKRVNSLFVYAENKDNSYMNAFVKYDTSTVPTKQWSRGENIFRLQDKCKSEVLEHRQNCRGNGLFIRYRFESDQEGYCKILGFSTNIKMDGQYGRSNGN